MKTKGKNTKILIHNFHFLSHSIKLENKDLYISYEQNINIEKILIMAMRCCDSIKHENKDGYISYDAQVNIECILVTTMRCLVWYLN